MSILSKNTSSSILWRGLIAIIFGLLAFFSSDFTISTLITVFGVYILLDATILTIESVIDNTTRAKWLQIIFRTSIGLIVLIFPIVTTLALLWVFAIQAIISGVFEIWLAVQIRKQVKGESLILTFGIISVLFGLLLIINPGVGALALIMIIGLFSIFSGIMLVIFAVNIRTYGTRNDSNNRAFSYKSSNKS